MTSSVLHEPQILPYGFQTCLASPHNYINQFFAKKKKKIFIPPMGSVFLVEP